MNRKLRHMTLTALLLLAGSVVMAQTDPQFVIKKGNHYLAHVNDALQKVDSFDPATCLWYSGPNIKNNYYYMKGSTRQYLLAPLELNGALSLHPNPGTVMLNTTSDDYFFYAWDHGVARGVQLPDLENCEELYHGLNDNGNQCWKVVWLSYYDSDGWKMSSEYGYNIITEVAALFHRVSITGYDAVITDESGGITDLVLNDFAMDFTSSPHASHSLDGEASPYSYKYMPAYTAYGLEAVIDEHFNIPEKFYYDHGDGVIQDEAPTATPYSNLSSPSYEWTLSGEGATYLSFSDLQNEQTSSSAKPTLWYRTQNTTNSHKLATLTLTVTYSTGAIQTRSATVTVKTECQNPEQASDPVVAFEGVTVSWLPTADSYKVSWRKVGGSSWTSAQVGNVTSYTIPNLEGSTTYEYKVKADCSATEPTTPYPTFTTKAINAVILGSVFGGGRMADVTGKTEVVIVNCDSIGAVYGGNDIAGTVEGNSGVNGSTITLGVDTGDPYASTYGTTDPTIGIRIGDVYGGGNGYYAYGTTSIQQASYNTTYDVADGAGIKAFTPLHPEGEVVWTNNTGSSYHLVPPTIPKAEILVANNYVKIDSLFGGAKNAILNNGTNDVNITIDGGTIFTVFGGNNFGGSLGYLSHERIIVNNTTVKTSVSDYQNNRMGRDFGIGYLFGGGNKVQGQYVEITVNGGQMDTVFGGGNSADVRSTQVTVNCALGAADSGNQFGKVFSNAISSCTGSGTPPTYTLTIKDEENYKWEGKGIYNIRTLFGGNNRADMAGVPTFNLTSGGIGTVYGGGNAGDMTAQETDDCTTAHSQLVINDNNVKYGTHVKTDSPNILIDYLYGGCQMSNVYYSTWVEIKGGHIGTVYGGCNISGDVGSTKINLNAPAFVGGVANEDYQKVYGAPYVVASGGTVYQNIFAGSNGLYHCTSSDEIYYVPGINYDPDHSYVGLTVPTHNETYVIIKDNVLVKHNVYAGGNMASVGFPDEREAFPRLVGLASVHMSGGTVDGNVFGGGNMASIYGSNEVQVSGGSIGVRLGGALYGGNDRLGKAGATSNRILPNRYNVASDGYTSLMLPEGEAEKVKTYVGVTGNPTIHTVYGGGNGAYDYTVPNLYCDATNLPIQSNIFVDIAIDGGNGTNGKGHITNVYGGGNGVYAEGYVKVFLNVQNIKSDDGDHVDTIYGGNNMGHLSIVPDIILLNGNVHTVYGGCNSGAMAATGDKTKSFTIGGTTYDNISSYVRLLNTYPGLPIVNNQPSAITPTAKVTGAVYGGCRMNGVTHNSLVCVEGGNHSGADFFGGSDISGDVSGISYVVVNGSYANNEYDGVVRDAYGGGNGNYDYTTGSIYEGKTPPYCVDSRVVMLGGKAANLYAGGYAGECGTTSMLVDGGLVTGSVFGGGNMAGLTTSHSLTTITVDEHGTPSTTTTTSTTNGSSIVTVSDGTVNTGIYGGCNSSGNIAGNVEVNVAGGQVGASDAARGNVHGGGYGAATQIAGNVTVNIGTANAASAAVSPVIYGDVYGGSALGYVNTNDKNTTSLSDITTSTTVNVLNGTLHGDVYGGGLGDAETNANGYLSGNGDVTEAYVYGTVQVNIGHPDSDNSTHSNYSKYLTLDGSVFGGNNLAGSPKANVYVDVYRTAHDANNIYPSSFPNPLENSFFEVDTRYALNEVYGGGNLAEYQPLMGGSTNVHVHNCDENTIKYVYGGGNAADVPTSHVTIDGGLVKYVFGGGNGDGTGNPGANVNGNNTLALNGGRMGYVFGGSNKVGMVHGETSLLFADPATCSPRSINELYGGGNQAECEAITLNVPCGTEGVKTIYGGSKNADVTGNSTTSTPGNVTLNVHGGALESVYGGNNIGGIIHGDVTVNLYGGTIDTVFGGNNHGGNILGLIKVNVLDEGNITCPLILTHVFGGGNKADYEPNPANVTSPVVNVMHITEKTGAPGIKGNVFGGGNLAGVTANPQVNIGYVNSLSSYVPSGYTAPASYRAYVAGNVYGGGNEAGVTGNPVVNMNNGTVVSGIFGGCNNSGTITGNIEVNVFDGTLGTNSVAMTEGIFGGGYGENTQTSGNISVNIGDATHEPVVYADVYGGSALGDVHATTADVTTVNFAKGTLNGNLYGGGLGQVTPSPISAEVNGNVVVNIGKDKAGTTIDGGHIYGSVFGANNINGSPKGTVTVNVYSAVTDSIFGGGNASPYTPTDATIAYPEVNVSGGEIKYKVVGGGNAAGITANPTVNISGGDVCTDNSTSKAGVYGGCNTSGTVTGDITLNITGTTTSQTTIGTLAALNAEKPVNVHGGGYGSGTATTGTVTVNFGVDDGSGHCEYPMLYGDLYGGSALGNVNSDVNDSTNVNILNGSVKCVKKTVGLSTVQYGGNIYGGGLGQVSPPIEAKVYGKVHVNIGAAPVAPSTDPTGMASLVNCNVYGCNNKNGSPQQDTYVDVYQTTHTETDNVNYTDEHSRTYAIQYVFGGGNQADYHPDENTGWAKKTHNHIHGCDNTVEIVYGGGNAADCDGVYLTVDGGRFDFVFGGGNGQLQEANVGEGSAIIYLKGGLIGWYFSGCNLHGSIAGTIVEHQGCEGDDCCQVFKIEKYYFGANEATIYGGIENAIDCSEASKYNFTYVYAGSRLAVVYGDIKLTVRGGTIGNLFGGSEGSVDISADVRKYPADWNDIANFPAEHQAGLRDYFKNNAHDDQYGKGGNIILNVEGGTIGTVFGGCDFRGRVEGDITVTIDSTQTGTCALDINYVYGGNNLAAYAPDSTLVGGVMTATPDPNRVSPKVIFKNGHINGTIYGGSKGGDSGHIFGNGLIVGNPKVVIGDTDASNKVKLGGTLTGVTPTTQGDGNVYGGGNAGKIIGDTDVILQGKATIGGNVFGGGKQADVEGSTNVTIVPNNP